MKGRVNGGEWGGGGNNQRRRMKEFNTYIRRWMNGG